MERQPIVVAKFTDTSMLLTLIRNIKPLTSEPTLRFTPNNIILEQYVKTSAVHIQLEIFQYKLIEYQYNTTEEEKRVVVDLDGLTTALKHIKPSNTTPFCLELLDDPLTLRAAVQTSESEYESIIKLKISDYEEYSWPGMADKNYPIRTIAASSLQNICSIVTNKTSNKDAIMAEVYNSGIRFKTLSMSEPQQCNIFGEVDEDDFLGTVKMKSSAISPFRKIKSVTVSGGTVRIYWDFDESAKVGIMRFVCDIGGYGELTFRFMPPSDQCSMSN